MMYLTTPLLTVLALIPFIAAQTEVDIPKPRPTTPPRILICTGINPKPNLNHGDISWAMNHYSLPLNLWQPWEKETNVWCTNPNDPGWGRNPGVSIIYKEQRDNKRFATTRGTEKIACSEPNAWAIVCRWGLKEVDWMSGIRWRV